MSDHDQPDEKRRHPVLSGIAALVGVSLVVGALLGGVTLVGTRAAGLDDSTTSGASDSATLYLPKPKRTKAPSGPEVTLNTQEAETAPSEASSEPAEQKPAKEISLSAGQTAVPPMGRIDLTGVYPGGEGAVLQVQKFSGGWKDFPVTAVVSNATFTTYVQTSYAGVNKFRVVDSDTGKASNPVQVTVG